MWIVTPVKEMLELHIITKHFVSRHKRKEIKQQETEKCAHPKSVCRRNAGGERAKKKAIFMPLSPGTNHICHKNKTLRCEDFIKAGKQTL